MQSLRKAAILRMATNAYEMDLEVLRGAIHRDSNGRWLVDDRDLLAWLASHEGEEVVVVMGLLDKEGPAPVRTCRTCGRDYTDLECPHCRANRIRLRGHA